MKLDQSWQLGEKRDKFSLLKSIKGDRMQNEKDVSRRAVLCGLAVLTLGLVPDTAIAATGVKVLANGKVEITLSRIRRLRK
jgi:hypothetical protein